MAGSPKMSPSPLAWISHRAIGKKNQTKKRNGKWVRQEWTKSWSDAPFFTVNIQCTFLFGQETGIIRLNLFTLGLCVVDGPGERGDGPLLLLRHLLRLRSLLRPPPQHHSLPSPWHRSVKIVNVATIV